jgi:site-specific recombinase XerD
MTFTPECNSQPNKAGVYAIFIRATENRKHKRILTSITITSKRHFSARAKYGNWISSANLNYKEINKAIVKELEHYISLGLELNKGKQAFDKLSEQYKSSIEQIKDKYLLIKDIAPPKENTKLIGLIEKHIELSNSLQNAYDNIESFFPPRGPIELHQIVSEYSTKLNEIEFSEKHIFELINTHHNADNPEILSNFINIYIERKKKLNKSLEYLYHIRMATNAFLKYANNPQLRVDEVTKKMISDYVEHLSQKITRTGQKYKNNSIIDLISRLSFIFEEAIADELILYNPTKKVNRPKRNKAIRNRLNDEMITRLENLHIDPQNRILWLAQKMFLFSFYNAGIRIGDCLSMRFSNIVEGRIEYDMSKNTKMVSGKLTQKSIDIIETMRAVHYTEDHDYIFGLLQKNKPYFKAILIDEQRKLSIESKTKLKSDKNHAASLIQAALKELAVMMEHTGLLTFHISRHSFADKAKRMMKKSNGKISIVDIQNMLRHSNLNTTQRYIDDFDVESLDEAMTAVFD